VTPIHNPDLVIVRGAGEMASGVIKHLFLAGFKVIALEKPHPDCVRRSVCFAEVFCEGRGTVEDITAVLIKSVDEAIEITTKQQIALLIDPEANLLNTIKPAAMIDGRMLKTTNDTAINMAPIVIGLGPGFKAGKNCHAVIETNRGSDLGKIIYQGTAQHYTGTPAPIDGIGAERVLRSPTDGIFKAVMKIGDMVKSGQTIGDISGKIITAPIDGVVRGLIRDDLEVSTGQKIGDIDPRGIREKCFKISSKANCIGKSAVKALTRLRAKVSK
jgi:xanthine dehydrogenase accessory factor